jgi:enoyl-CoA hydratase
MPDFEEILVSPPSNGVAIITLNRARARNALNNRMLSEVARALDAMEVDASTHCVIICGSEKIFAAGADLQEMAALNMTDVLADPRPKYWTAIRQFSKPIIAAVNGYALGGGCELAMHADIIIAGHNAQFGQPEINLGIIPGAGGTQRLIRCVGKSLASQMVLSGEFIDAERAREAGLVSEICQPELTLQRAIEVASLIASKPPLAVLQAREMLNKSFEMSLSSALDHERKSFVMLSGTEDRNEGINAFLEKRKPEFSGK